MNNPSVRYPDAVEPESSVLEYKENAESRTWMKTASAFANYRDGIIQFGITDQRRIIGVTDPEQTALNLENQLNDNIIPRPRFEISFDMDSGVVTVQIFKGENVPYRYKGKAYRRSGTSTVEVSDYELNQLILQGRNLEFCDLPARQQQLTFSFFSSFWSRFYALPVNNDLLATLGCCEAEEYTNTAELLSDQNSFPGISVVQFDKTISQISDRRMYEQESVLKIYDDALQMITDRITYEEISGIYRELKTKVPLVALRETLINALAHRDWSISEPVRIELHPDRLTILSPGGLPGSMSVEEYLYSNRSIPRNTQLTIIFLRLYLIEKLGTGLRRVRESYNDFPVKPAFKVFPNSISVELPFTNEIRELSPDMNLITDSLRQNGVLKRKQIETMTGFSQSKTIRLLKELVQLKRIEKTGSGPATEYRLP